MTATATKDAHQKDAPLVEFHELHVDTLAVVGDNIREVGDVAELAASIKTDGMIEPIVATMRAIVDEDGQDDLGVRFTVVAGHRRLAAAKLAGLEMVPVILRSMDEEQRVRAMLVENLIRENLTPLEEARAYKRLVDEFDLTQRELSVQVGKSQGHISKRMGLLELPQEVQAEVDSGGIAIADAVELAKLAGHPERIELALNDRSSWETTTAAVEKQLKALERAKAVDAVELKLTKAGVKVVRMIDDGGYQTKLPKGVRKLVKSSSSYEVAALVLDPKKHESEPCHAVTIEPRSLEEISVCTNRRNHPNAKTVGEKRDEAYNASHASNETKRDRVRDEFDESTRARRTFLAEFVGGKALPKADLLTLILNKLIDDAIEYGETEAVELAAVALGLATTNAEGELEVDCVDAINQFVAKSEANRLRAALAITLADSETSITLGWGWREAAPYFALLEKHGYKPSKFERSKLPKPANKRTATSAAAKRAAA